MPPQQLARIAERKFALPGERSLLFPSASVASECRSFLRRHSPTPVTVRLVQYMICPQSSTEKPTLIPPTSSKTIVVPSPCQASSSDSVELHIVLFPADTFPLAKSFWQHTGDGISSRMAEKCLEFLGVQPELDGSPTITVRALATTPGGRYGKSKQPLKNGKKPIVPVTTPTTTNGAPTPVKSYASETELDSLTNDHTAYLEERYGRSLPLSSYSVAKRALRRRIAGVLLRDSNSPSDPVEPLGADETAVGESWRGVKNVSEDDVYLYPTGMSAIWHSHQLAIGSAEKRFGKAAGKSICFGCVSSLEESDSLVDLVFWLFFDAASPTPTRSRSFRSGALGVTLLELVWIKIYPKCDVSPKRPTRRPTLLSPCSASFLRTRYFAPPTWRSYGGLQTSTTF